MKNIFNKIFIIPFIAVFSLSFINIEQALGFNVSYIELFIGVIAAIVITILNSYINKKDYKSKKLYYFLKDVITIICILFFIKSLFIISIP